jgi:hypothetical protein
LLQPEHAAVNEFEQSVKGTPAQIDFEIAKADVTLELAQNPGNCWAEYNDLAVANAHLKMTQDQVGGTLARLRSLSSSLPQIHLTSMAAKDGAQFRSVIRRLVRRSRPRCQWTVKATNAELFAPARLEIARFRSKLDGSVYAANFDLAEADIAVEDSVVRVECDPPGRGDPKELSARFLSDTKNQIAQIERSFSIH